MACLQPAPQMSPCHLAFSDGCSCLLPANTSCPTAADCDAEISSCRLDELWQLLSWQLVRQLNLSSHVPSPSLTSSASQQLSPTSIFFKLAAQNYLSGGESRYCCVGPLFAVVDMARSDVARLQRQLRRHTHPLCSSQLNSQQQPVATVECRTKQGCDVKLQADGLQCVRVDNVDQLTDVYIDMAAAAELRGVERIYLVSELVRAERLCVTMRDSCGADTTQLWRGSDVMVAFICKKFRLTSHGLIDRPLSTPVGFKHRSYFQRAVSHEDCVATSPVEPHVCDQHAPHPDNNRYVMLYARPISQYNDAATDERRVDESPLAEQITANSRVPSVPEIVVDTPRRQCSTTQNVTNYDANTCAIFARTDCIDFATLEDVDSEG